MSLRRFYKYEANQGLTFIQTLDEQTWKPVGLWNFTTQRIDPLPFNEREPRRMLSLLGTHAVPVTDSEECDLLFLLASIE
jgi:hypothetical protein